MATGRDTNIRIQYFMHSAEYVTVNYIERGSVKLHSIPTAKIWQYVVKNKLHVTDDETGEVWEKEEFFKECKLIVEGLIKQKWQNLA